MLYTLKYAQLKVNTTNGILVMFYIYPSHLKWLKVAQMQHSREYDLQIIDVFRLIVNLTSHLFVLYDFSRIGALAHTYNQRLKGGQQEKI